MSLLLLVEDDESLSTPLKQDLECQGYAVDLATQGIEAEFMGEEMNYDLV
jgi:DNA-binding response OmpR family regulator